MERLLEGSYSEQQRLQDFLRLDIHAEKLRGIDRALGPEGIGTFVVKNVLSPDQLEVMEQEIFDPHRVTWRDNHRDFINGRGNLVEQNHSVFAVKLHRGDRSYIDRVPHQDDRPGHSAHPQLQANLRVCVEVRRAHTRLGC